MNKKMILSAVSLLLVFSMVAVLFTGCDSSSTEETTTEVTYTAEELPTDITTLVDDESNVYTDTKYTPEQLEANTDKIFDYVNRQMNELSDDYAKVKMSQGKGIGDSRKAVELTEEEQNKVYQLAKEAIDSSTAEFDSRTETAKEKIESAEKKIADAQEEIAKTEAALEKAKAANKASKIKKLNEELETSKKALEYGQIAKAAAEYDLVKIDADKKAAEAFNGKNLEVLTPDQYDMVCAYIMSQEGFTITRRLDGTYFFKKYEGVPMCENEYIATSIKTLDNYMLHTDGFETAENVKVADYIPCAGKDYIFALTREDVKSATCVDNEGQREIILTLKGHEFSDEIEQSLVEKAYNIETVKNAEILAIEEEIGAANGKVDEANKKIEAADKAIAKAEKKNDTAALEKAKADKAAAEAEKAAAEKVKATAEKKKLDALTLKSIDKNVDDIMKEFESANAYLTAEKPVLKYKDCQIIIRVNLEKDEIHTIEYKKSVDVSTNVTGQGTLAEVGTVPVNFNYNSTVTYNIERPVEETTAAK